MFGLIVFLAEAAAVAALCFVLFLLFRKKLSRRSILLLCAILVWAGIFGHLISSTRSFYTDEVVVRATGEKNPSAIYNEVWLKDIHEKGSTKLPRVKDGRWIWINSMDLRTLYCYVPEEDFRWIPEMTQDVILEFPVGSGRTLEMVANIYGGIAEITAGGETVRVDTYKDTVTEDSFMTANIPDSEQSLLQKNQLMRSALYMAVLLAAFAVLTAAVAVLQRTAYREKIQKNRFLFEELVKRDFTLKYKRTVLGILWSVLSPLLTLLVMNLVLSNFFGANIDHYIIYLFCGQLVFNYFNEATTVGMTALLDNAGIFTKVNVPKYLFVFSKNIASFISFLLTFLVLIIFVLADGLPVTMLFFSLVYPVLCLIVFNIGVGLLLSAAFVFFRDMLYLWNVFTLLMMYVSAIFYNVSGYPAPVRSLFYLNPVYVIISYFRTVVIDGVMPSALVHFLAAFYAAGFLLAGIWVYKKYNHEFLYYV